MSHRKVPWSDLPEELLIPIVDRLENRHDILHVRAVCKEWRRCVSMSLLSNKRVLSTILPHKLRTTNPPLLKGGASFKDADFYGEEPPITCLILVASSIFLIKPVFNPKLPPWLVTIEELNPGKVFLRRPLSRSEVGEMPRDFPKLLDLSRFEVEEMGKIYSLRSDDEPNHLFEEEHKVLLLADPNDCNSEFTIGDYTAVVLYDSGSIAAINLGTEKVQQVFLKARKFDDIVLFKERVYTIDRYGILYLMDNTGSDRFKMVKIVKDSLHSPDGPKSRLFESCGELYMVRKCMVTRPRLKKKTMGIRVYRMNNDQKNWVEMESIGEDRILFVALDCCFFARTSDFIGWKGNCAVLHKRNSFRSQCQSSSYVQYSDDFDRDYYVPVKPRDGDQLTIDVFHFEDCTFLPVEGNQCYCAVFWPPPEWLSTSDTEYLLAHQIKVREDLELDCNGHNSQLKVKEQGQSSWLRIEGGSERMVGELG
ncbi:F-box protein SKIP23-like [Silene latifolia]|uniref:F-box protein SKIP23-like n=1 Tax=Silene latifolia TaxID=37657 RepID=UPI003D777C03